MRGQGIFSKNQLFEEDPISNENNRSYGNRAKIDSSIYSDFPTLYDAIRKAGGITLNSDLENIEVIRKNPISKGGGLVKAKINFLDFLYNQNTQNNIRIFDEDTIIVNKTEKNDKSLLQKP